MFLLQILAHVPPMQRERVAQVLMAPGYLRKLLDLFRVSTARHSTAGSSKAGQDRAGHDLGQHCQHRVARRSTWSTCRKRSCGDGAVQHSSTCKRCLPHAFPLARLCLLTCVCVCCGRSNVRTWRTLPACSTCSGSCAAWLCSMTRR